jgi:hypothetical protein
MAVLRSDAAYANVIVRHPMAARHSGSGLRKAARMLGAGFPQGVRRLAHPEQGEQE